MLYRCYCFNYTLINFLLSFIPILSVLQSQRDIHEHIGGGFFTFLIGVEYVIVSAASLLPVVFSSGFFFLDLDDKLFPHP